MQVASAGTYDVETTMGAWSTWELTRYALNRQFRHAIKRRSSDMARALRTARELEMLWRLVKPYDTEPGKIIGGLTRSQSASVLESSIKSIGRAIAREERNSRRSVEIRILRLPYDLMRSSPSTHKKRARTALQQLDDHFQRCVSAATEVYYSHSHSNNTGEGYSVYTDANGRRWNYAAPYA